MTQHITDDLTGEVVDVAQITTDAAIAAARLVAEKQAEDRARSRSRVAAPPRPKGYAYIYPRALEDISLSNYEWKVAHHLMSITNPATGTCHYSTPRIVVHFGTGDRSQVTRAIRAIVAQGLFHRLGRGVLGMNPELIWVGGSTQQHKALTHIEFHQRQENQS